MPATPLKCIIVLSDKASGSSALQSLLAMVADVHHVEVTRHQQSETLYWTKAASVLGLPQVDLIDSEVPIPAAAARTDLEALLADNLGDTRFTGADADTLVFEGWRALCERFAPVFLEKSPHHLHQRSALDLIEQARRRMPEIEFLLVGLVRNPVDTLHSAWRQWRTPPEEAERQWAAAYRNLLDLRQRDPSLVVVRYEEMVVDPGVLEPVLAFAGAIDTPDPTFLHGRSLGKWRADRRFGFVPGAETVDVAAAFGYAPADVAGRSWALWPAYRRAARIAHRRGSLHTAAARAARPAPPQEVRAVWAPGTGRPRSRVSLRACSCPSTCRRRGRLRTAPTMLVDVTAASSVTALACLRRPLRSFRHTLGGAGVVRTQPDEVTVPHVRGNGVQRDADRPPALVADVRLLRVDRRPSSSRS